MVRAQSHIYVTKNTKSDELSRLMITSTKTAWNLESVALNMIKIEYIYGSCVGLNLGQSPIQLSSGKGVSAVSKQLSLLL